MFVKNWASLSKEEAVLHQEYGNSGLMILILGLLALDAAGVTADAVVSVITGWQRGSLAWTEASVFTLSSVFLMSCFFLALNKHNLFPRLMIVALFFDIILHSAIIISIVGDENLYPYREYGFSVVGAFLTIIIDCLFIAYLIYSTRVNLTYRLRVANVDEPIA